MEKKIMYIEVGAHRLGTTDSDLVRLLGWETPYSNDETQTCRPLGSCAAHIGAVATALSEGLSGEPALLRAAALVHDVQSRVRTANATRAAEDVRLHAARVERQAAILRAKAAHIPATEIAEVVR